MGVTISLFLLVIFVWANLMIKLPIALNYATELKTLGIAFVLFGLGLHFCSFFTLRNWWVDDKLCTSGPFRYFRHPMYAAWITFICPGIALYLNSWLYLFWVFLLQCLWHMLVKREENIMVETFGEMYRNYAKATGRFFPKISNISNND